jgi:uncharacterized protein (TIGR02147 family)
MTSDQVQIKVREFLVEAFADAKAVNARYSLRAFAKRVGVSPGALSELIKGHRPISSKTIDRIERKLDLPPQFFAQMKRESDDTKTSTSLTLDQFAILADPIHFAILALMDTSNIVPTVDEIARRLGRLKRDVQGALDKMESLDLVEKREIRWISTGESLESPDEVTSRAIKKSHRLSLREAEVALDEIDIEWRDFTTLTLAFDASQISAAKKLIRKFRKDFSKISEKRNCDEVYKLAIQFFPLTKRENKEKEK